MRNTAPRRMNPAMGRNSYSYIRGNAAPAFPQEDYSYRPGRRQQQRRPKPVPVETVGFTRYDEKANRSIWYVLLLTVSIVLCSIALLSINSSISAVKSQIRQADALTQKTIGVNEQLEYMLSNAVDMDKVKQVATTRLGMQTAAEHQIVRINVEKDSYSIQYDDQVKNNGKKTLLERIGLKK